MQKHVYKICFITFFAIFAVSIFVQNPAQLNLFAKRNTAEGEYYKAQMLQEDKININTAVVAQLDCLEGIGEAKAQEIINYRNEHGDFKSIEEIIEVKGISEKMFLEFKEIITV